MSKRFKFFLTTFILSLPFWWGMNVFQGKLEKFFYAQISKPFEEITSSKFFEDRPEKSINNLVLGVKSAILLRTNQFLDKEEILFKKEIYIKLPIASLTKLMTALIVFEDPENYNFSKILTVSERAASQEDAPEYGYLKAGETKRVAELLDLMLIYSSNDSAFALSQVIGVENFVERMNKKARSLGLIDTYFVNPTGLDSENLSYSKETDYFFNYSTARDLAKLSQYILKEFPIIFEISVREPAFPLKNNSFRLTSNQTIIGKKTGYTKEAGGCMILVLGQNDNYFINVILGTETTEARTKEMQKLVNWLK